jgi:hypothetical protein
VGTATAKIPASCPLVGLRANWIYLELPLHSTFTSNCTPPSFLIGRSLPQSFAVVSPDVTPRQCRGRAIAVSPPPAASLPAGPTFQVATRRRYTSPVKLSKKHSIPKVQLLSFVLLAIVLVIQFVLPQILGGRDGFTGDYAIPTHSTPVLSPAVISSQDAICESPPLFSIENQYSKVRKMGLLEEAEKVAAEFEYPPEAVAAGVKEFLRQMGERA